MTTAYATAAEADVFFACRQDAAHWENLPENVKNAALEQASRILDESFDWKGEPAAEGQPLRWPRKNVTDPDGLPVDPAEIPQQIRNAAMEQALYRTDPVRSVSGVFRTGGIKAASAGAMSLSFDGTETGKRLAPSVASIVRGFGVLRSSGGVPAKCGQTIRG